MRKRLLRNLQELQAFLEKLDPNLDTSLQHHKHRFPLTRLFMLISGSRQKLCELLLLRLSALLRQAATPISSEV